MTMTDDTTNLTVNEDITAPL